VSHSILIYPSFFKPSFGILYSYGAVEFNFVLKKTLVKDILNRAPNSLLKTNSINFRHLN